MGGGYGGLGGGRMVCPAVGVVMAGLEENTWRPCSWGLDGRLDPVSSSLEPIAAF